MTGVKPWNGVPLHPERDGWHFLHHPEDLRPAPIPWDAAHQAWCSGGMHSPQGVLDLGYRYLGPCLTLPKCGRNSPPPGARARRRCGLKSKGSRRQPALCTPPQWPQSES